MKLSALTFVGVVACLIGLETPALGCVNTFESELLHYKLSGDEQGLAKVIKQVEAAYEGEPTLEHTNDLAVARLLTGRYPEAIKLLEDLDKRFPGRAIVAANLGTALELSGKDADALRWIREGVKRDSKEHFGTEWLHVKILEARIALARDPQWLSANSVLGVNFGEQGRPVMPAVLPADDSGRARAPAELVSAIGYQLRERKQFVEPPDPVMADLYAAQGDLVYVIGKPATFEEYLGIPTDSYEAALIYGPVHRKRVELRRQHFDANYNYDTWMPAFTPHTTPDEVDATWQRRLSLSWPWIVLPLSVATGVGVYLARRRSLTKP